MFSVKQAEVSGCIGPKERRFEATYVLNWLVVDDETAGPLIQNTVKHLVENHLAESEARKHVSHRKQPV